MEKTKTVVHIAGKEYTIAGNESSEYIHRVALYVSEKMQQIKEANKRLDNTMLAVLTAVNIADEYLKAKEDLEKKEKEIERLKHTTGTSRVTRR